MATGKSMAERKEEKAGGQPTKLKILVYEGNGESPVKSVSIPLGVFSIARSFIPDRALEALRKEGIDLDRIRELVRNVHTPATLIEVEDHQKNKKVVVRVE